MKQDNPLCSDCFKIVGGSKNKENCENIDVMIINDFL